MELAEVSEYLPFSSSSINADLTIAWQSSNVPSTSTAVIFCPHVVNCNSCIGLTFPVGYKIITSTASTPRKPLATCAAGVARCCHEYRGVVVAVSVEITEATAHEPGAHVFKSECRPMKEFQGKISLFTCTSGKSKPIVSLIICCNTASGMLPAT